MIFIVVVKKYLRIILHCLGALKYQEKNRFIKKKVKINLLLNYKNKNPKIKKNYKKILILIILLMKNYHNMKNLNRSKF